MNSSSFHLLAATLRVGEKRIAAVDDDVAFLHQRREFADDLIDRFAGLDHDHGFARFLERADEFFDRARRLNVFSLGASGSEFVGDFSRAIKNGDGKSLRFHVEDEIFAHHGQADQANITLIRGHFDLLCCHAERSETF